jgi:cytochrome c556
MKRIRTRAGVVALVLGLAAAAGCAAQAARVGTGDPVADRQRLMKNVGANWQDIQNKGKAGQIEAIAVNADTLALNAMHIPALFPKGSLTDKSKAKPEIWERWAEFQAAAKNLEDRATRLAEVAKAKNAQATQDMLKDFGREACGKCHTPFRVPPPRQG